MTPNTKAETLRGAVEFCETCSCAHWNEQSETDGSIAAEVILEAARAQLSALEATDNAAPDVLIEDIIDRLKSGEYTDDDEERIRSLARQKELPIIYVWWADNGNVRKFSHEPFPEATAYKAETLIGLSDEQIMEICEEADRIHPAEKWREQQIWFARAIIAQSAETARREGMESAAKIAEEYWGRTNIAQGIAAAIRAKITGGQKGGG